MEPLVSILIPVFNAENFIVRALESCINQTYKNIEIVVVDDCSTDSTLEILNNYRKFDSRIYVISKKNNEGVIAARNTLISNCNGKYIMFCDADDFMERNAVSRVVTIFENENVDSVIFRYRLIKNGFTRKLRKKYLKNGKWDKKKYMKKHLKYPRTLFWGVLWNKGYKSEIIKNLGINFDTDLEDVIFNIKYFGNSRKCFIISDCLYNYNQTNISLTRKKNEDSFELKEIYQMLRSKWNNYCKAYLQFVEAYNDNEFSRLDEFYLNRYLYSIFLDIVNDSNKYGSNDIIYKINNETIFRLCVQQLGFMKYFILIEWIFRYETRILKKYAIKFISYIKMGK